MATEMLLVEAESVRDLKQFAQELMMDPEKRQDGENIKWVLEKLKLWEEASV